MYLIQCKKKDLKYFISSVFLSIVFHLHRHLENIMATGVILILNHLSSEECRKNLGSRLDKKAKWIS